MSKSCALILFLLIFLVSPAQAWIDRNGNTLENTADRKSVGNFGAWLLLIDNEEKFYRKWKIPGTLNVKTVKKIRRNSSITALIIFSGCAADPNGNCHVLVDFHITLPNGKSYGKMVNQPLWINRPNPKTGTLQIGESFIRARIEPHEPTGMYGIRASIKDKNSATTIDLETTFLAHE